MRQCRLILPVYITICKNQDMIGMRGIFHNKRDYKTQRKELIWNRFEHYQSVTNDCKDFQTNVNTLHPEARTGHVSSCERILWIATSTPGSYPSKNINRPPIPRIKIKSVLSEQNMPSDKSKGEERNHNHSFGQGKGGGRKLAQIISNKGLNSKTKMCTKGARRGRPCLNKKNGRVVNVSKKSKLLTPTKTVPTLEYFRELKRQHSLKNKEIRSKVSNKSKTSKKSDDSDIKLGSCKDINTTPLLLNVAILNTKESIADRTLYKMFPHVFCKCPKIILEKLDLKSNIKYATVPLLPNMSEETTQGVNDVQDTSVNEEALLSGDNVVLNQFEHCLPKLDSECTFSDSVQKKEPTEYNEPRSGLDTNQISYDGDIYLKPVRVDLSTLKIKLKNIDISKFKAKKSTADGPFCALEERSVLLQEQQINNVLKSEPNISKNDTQISENNVCSDLTNVESLEKSNDTEAPTLTYELQIEESKEVGEGNITCLVPPVLEPECIKSNIFTELETNVLNIGENTTEQINVNTLETIGNGVNTEIDSRKTFGDMQASVGRTNSQDELTSHSNTNDVVENITSTVDDLKQLKFEHQPYKMEGSFQEDSYCKQEEDENRPNSPPLEMGPIQKENICTAAVEEGHYDKPGNEYTLTFSKDDNRIQCIVRSENDKTTKADIAAEDIPLSDIEHKPIKELQSENTNHLSNLTNSPKDNYGTTMQNTTENNTKTRVQNIKQNSKKTSIVHWKKPHSRKRSHSYDKGYDSDATVIYDEDVSDNDAALEKAHYAGSETILSKNVFSTKVDDNVLALKSTLADPLLAQKEDIYHQKLCKTLMAQCDDLRFRKVFINNENLDLESTNGSTLQPPNTSATKSNQNSTKIKLVNQCMRGAQSSLSGRLQSKSKKPKDTADTTLTIRVLKSKKIKSNQNKIQLPFPKTKQNKKHTSETIIKKQNNQQLTEKVEVSQEDISKSSSVTETAVLNTPETDLVQSLDTNKQKQSNSKTQNNGLAIMKRKTKFKRSNRKGDLMRRVEEVFPSPKKASQSDEEELPTILPPKRRRQIQKTKAMIDKSSEATNGMERLIQEFPRHNWLENKYSTGEISSNGFDGDFDIKKNNEMDNAEVENEKNEVECMESLNREKSDIHDSDMVVSTTTSVLDSNDCFDVESLPLMMANMEHGVNLSNQHVDKQLSLEQNNCSKTQGDDTTEETVSENSEITDKGYEDNSQDTKQEEPHSTLDLSVTKTGTTVNADNVSEEFPRNEEVVNSENNKIVEFDMESSTTEICDVNTRPEKNLVASSQDNIQDVRKPAQHKLPPIPSLIPVSLHALPFRDRSLNSCDEKLCSSLSDDNTGDAMQHNITPSQLQNVLSAEEPIENQQIGSDTNILSISSVMSENDSSEPPCKIQRLDNSFSGADTNLSRTESLSEQLDNPLVMQSDPAGGNEKPSLITENSNVDVCQSLENTNAIQDEFERHLREFRELELLAERKAREREFLLNLQREKAKLIQKLGVEGLNLIKNDTKRLKEESDNESIRFLTDNQKYTSKLNTDIQMQDISKPFGSDVVANKASSDSKQEQTTLRSDSGSNKEKTENATPPPAHQASVKTSADLITKLDTSIHSVPPYIKASCPFISRKTAIQDPPGHTGMNCHSKGEVQKAHCQAPFETPGRLIFPLPSLSKGHAQLKHASNRDSIDISNKEKPKPNARRTEGRSASAPIQTAGTEFQPVIKTFPIQRDEFIPPSKSVPICLSVSVSRPTDLTTDKDKTHSLESNKKVGESLDVQETGHTDIVLNMEQKRSAAEKTDVIDLSEENTADRRRTEIEVQKELNAALARRQKQETSNNNQMTAGAIKSRGRINSRESIKQTSLEKLAQEGFNAKIIQQRLNPQPTLLTPINVQGLPNSEISPTRFQDPNALKNYSESRLIPGPNRYHNMTAITNAILSPPLHPRTKQINALPLCYPLPVNERVSNAQDSIAHENVKNHQNQYTSIQKHSLDHHQSQQHHQLQQFQQHHHHLQQKQQQQQHHVQQQQQHHVLHSPAKLHPQEQLRHQQASNYKQSSRVNIQTTDTKYLNPESAQRYHVQQQLKQQQQSLNQGQLRPQTVRLLGARTEVRYSAPVPDLSRPIYPKPNQSDCNGQKLHLTMSPQEQVLLQQRQKQQQMMRNGERRQIEGLTNPVLPDSRQRHIVHRADPHKQLQQYNNNNSQNSLPTKDTSHRQIGTDLVHTRRQSQSALVQDNSGTVPRLLQVPGTNQIQHRVVQQTLPRDQQANVTNGAVTPLQRAQTQIHGTQLQQVHGSCILCGKYALYLCSGCKQIWYCSPQCQLNHWQTHSTECKSSSS